MTVVTLAVYRQFSISLQRMSMRGKEQLREIDRGRNVENGTLLISQLKYECADIIDNCLLSTIWTMGLIFHRFCVWSNVTEGIECQAPYISRYWNPQRSNWGRTSLCRCTYSTIGDLSIYQLDYRFDNTRCAKDNLD